MRTFECLKCGSTSPLAALPARCPQCSHRTGIIHNAAPGRAAGVSLPVTDGSYWRRAALDSRQATP
jgi:hypothetical protein